MDYADILYDVEEAAAIITLNRPQRLNAWGGAMDREFRDALKRADADSGVRAVIVTGAGRGFCAGADMGNLNTIAAAGGEDVREDPRARASGIEANYHQRFTFPLQTKKPLLGAINGPAVGLGLILSLYCDMRFASDQAKFGAAFSSIGLVAEHGVSWMLPRVVGIGHALDMLYSSRVVGAEEALRMGLVNRLVPHDQLLPATKEYARYLAEHASPRAMQKIKKLVYDAQFTDLATAIQTANAVMADSLREPDFQEGLNAFAEKRLPRFEGISE
ncbi:MAG: enoyl-CoA hydratase [Chloroflexi bacterium]|nr:enoyl-CoA hydratase [Chloroflexota bacterium]